MMDMRNKIRIRRFQNIFKEDNLNLAFNLYPTRKNWSEQPCSFNDLTEAEIIKKYYASAFMKWVDCMPDWARAIFPLELGWTTINAIEVDTNDEEAEDKYILELYKVYIAIKLVVNKANKNLSFEDLLPLSIDDLETIHDEPIIEARKKNEQDAEKLQNEPENEPEKESKEQEGFFTRWFKINV